MRIFPSHILVPALALGLIAATAIAAGPLVNLGYAKYEGTVDSTSNVTTFMGIRYAAPPLGDLRFRAPQAPDSDPDAGVLQAKTQPPQCWQLPLLSSGAALTNPFLTRDVSTAPSNVSSEDCLFLNVYYPSDSMGVPPAEGLPTLVWIHGGGYLWGSASEFRGTDLLNQSNRGVVVVTIQYRLGLFGFLAGFAVKKYGSLNAGLLDQDFALRWVNKHISKFGGDPAQVTIWGQSAGAGSVLQHIIANGGKTEPQLFQAAITSSLFLPSQYEYNDRIPELVYSEVVTQSNCMSTADTLACLRSADVSVLQAANININLAAFSGDAALIPVVDGSFIQQRPSEALAQGRFNPLQALLATTNTFEGTFLVNASLPVVASGNLAQYALELFPMFGEKEAENVAVLYADFGLTPAPAVAVYSEAIFVCPTYTLLRAFGGSAFRGEFALPPGAHGLDLQYYFPSLALHVPALTLPSAFFNNSAFIDAFAQSFTAFAISRDPNEKVSETILPEWSRWDVDRAEMVFNKTVDGEPDIRSEKTDEALLQRCRFWTSVSGLTAQ